MSRLPKSQGSRACRRGQRLSWIYVVAVLAAMTIPLPWILGGVIGALASNSNDPRQWLPRNFDETKKYDWLQEHFGRDEITVVSWPGCTLDDDRAHRLAEAIVAHAAHSAHCSSPAGHAGHSIRHLYPQCLHS